MRTEIDLKRCQAYILIHNYCNKSIVLENNLTFLILILYIWGWGRIIGSTCHRGFFQSPGPRRNMTSSPGEMPNAVGGPHESSPQQNPTCFTDENICQVRSDSLCIKKNLWVPALFPFRLHLRTEAWGENHSGPDLIFPSTIFILLPPCIPMLPQCKKVERRQGAKGPSPSLPYSPLRTIA